MHAPRRSVTNVLGTFVVLAAIATGCAAPAPTPFPPPTEVEAIKLLANVVGLVVNNDVADICQFGSGTCDIELRNADPAAMPKAGPWVLGTEVIEPAQRQDGSWDLGGRLVKVCGHDGLQRPYYTEMLAFKDAGGRLRSINALYWLGGRIAQGPITPAGTPEPPACPM